MFEPNNITDVKDIIQNSLNNGQKLSIRRFYINNNNIIKDNNILNISKLNKIKDYNKNQGIISVECGVFKDIIDKTIIDGWFIHSVLDGWR